MDSMAERRTRLVAQIEEWKAECRQEVARWTTLYPAITVELTKWSERRCADLDGRLAQFDANQAHDIRASIEVDKRRLWEKLVILGSVDPEMNIVEIHDQACAQLDQALAVGEAQKREIEAATSQTLAAMGDMTIDYHLANKEKQSRPHGSKES